MHDAIKDGMSEGLYADEYESVFDRFFGCEQRRPLVVTVINDLHKNNTASSIARSSELPSFLDHSRVVYNYGTNRSVCGVNELFVQMEKPVDYRKYSSARSRYTGFFETSKPYSALCCSCCLKYPFTNSSDFCDSTDHR